MSPPQYGVDLDVRDGWVELPDLDGGELGAWAAGAADRLGAADDVARTLLVDDLLGWVEDAASRGTVLTLLCYADGQAPPLATTEVAALPAVPTAGDEALDLSDGALAALSTALPPWLEPPGVQQVLDAGAAVRVRGRCVDEAEPGESLVVQSLSYLLPPRASGAGSP